jgi:hypothetical protein
VSDNFLLQVRKMRILVNVVMSLIFLSGRIPVCQLPLSVQVPARRKEQKGNKLHFIQSALLKFVCLLTLWLAGVAANSSKPAFVRSLKIVSSVSFFNKTIRSNILDHNRIFCGNVW